ncbi:MAG: dTDP-4-dehydrorhamnose reductase [Calditrichales bacterium]|nr:MAG: dTDP-4-dehydrorhamnose reductase [Calditrichales bacterium]
MEKILITGSNGLLGQALIKQFKDGYYLIGCDISDEDFNKNVPLNEFYNIDLTKRDKVQRFFAAHKPDIIVNTAALTNVDQCEDDRDLCWALNVRIVELILEAVESYSPLFVQVSTDYVFDGKTGYYQESDKTNPVSYYGHTKLAAEKIILASGLEYIIARTMILYGHGYKVRNNFVTWVIDQLKAGKKIKVIDGQRGNPTLVDDLAEAIFRLISKKEYGVFHISGSEDCTRLEFARRIAKNFELNLDLIQEIDIKDLVQKAPRPSNSTFNLDKLNNTLDWLPGNLDASLLKLKSRMAEGNDIE